MRIRTRLSLAFFLISVVPLGLVTAYSYYSSAAALRRAVESQADRMAAEMGDRMSWVMTDLGDRVERLWRMRVDSPAADAARPATGESADSAVAELRTVATAMLAEAAPLVRRLEFESSPAGSVAEPGPAGARAAAGRRAGLRPQGWWRASGRRRQGAGGRPGRRAAVGPDLGRRRGRHPGQTARSRHGRRAGRSLPACRAS